MECDARSVGLVTLVDELEVIAMGCVAVTARSLVEASATELTFTQWRALVVIASSPDIRVGALGALLGAQQSATSRLVSRLVRRGLVSAQADPADRRATTLRLSPAGIEVHERVTSARRRHLADLAEVLGHSGDGEPRVSTLAVALGAPSEMGEGAR